MRMPFARLGLSLITVLAVFVCSQVAVAGVLAHAEPVAFDPAPESVLDEAPLFLTIIFSADLAEGTSIMVVDEQGADVTDGPTIWTANEATVALQPLGSGVYVVTWISVSAEDGDEASDSFLFTISDPV